MTVDVLFHVSTIPFENHNLTHLQYTFGNYLLICFKSWCQPTPLLYPWLLALVCYSRTNNLLVLSHFLIRLVCKFVDTTPQCNSNLLANYCFSYPYVMKLSPSSDDLGKLVLLKQTHSHVRHIVYMPLYTSLYTILRC